MIAPYVQAAADAPLTCGSSLHRAEVEAVIARDRARFRFAVELFGDAALVDRKAEPELRL